MTNRWLALMLASTSLLFGQQASLENATADTASADDTPASASVASEAPPPESKRIFGIIPNYRTSPSLKDFKPLTPGEKFKIATEDSFDRETGPHGALYVGSPETVARKIATNLRALEATRFDLKYGMPGLTHEQLMTNIELYGQQVIPRVRELLG